MSRVPIRLRLTAAFAVAMVVVLAAAAVFVYVRLRADLNESVTAGLVARAAAVAGAGATTAAPPGDAEEGFAHHVGADGTLRGSAGAPPRAVLGEDELRRVARGERILTERQVPGIEGTTRILARPGGDRTAVVVGQSLDDRDETLAGLVTSFAVGGPIAVLAASLLGYALAASGLRPIEAMRRRAGEISLGGAAVSVPLPGARDEVRRLGETLNEMLGRLQGALARERRFVADASHELRTPVAVIKAELEAALRAGGHDPSVREALAAALEECDNLAQLAEDLLVVARAEGGGLPVHIEPVPARALLEAVRRRFADRARERGREIRVDAPRTLVLHGDELRLGQALGNLVDNALRHGDGEIVLRAAGAGDGVTLEVQDAGPGFAPAFAAHAFDRFARGESARGRDGTGLGLAIVRMIAQAHQGHAELGAGEATTVRIWLPGAAPPQGPLSEGA